MNIIPRRSMVNLGRVLGEDNTLVVETCFLVKEARIILKECLLETLEIDIIEANFFGQNSSGLHSFQVPRNSSTFSKNGFLRLNGPQGTLGNIEELISQICFKTGL